MKATHVAAAMLIDYPCERQCQVEIDLEEVASGTTTASVIRTAAVAHDEAHAAEPRRHYRFSDAVLVRATAVVTG